MKYDADVRDCIAYLFASCSEPAPGDRDWPWYLSESQLQMFLDAGEAYIDVEGIPRFKAPMGGFIKIIPEGAKS